MTDRRRHNRWLDEYLKDGAPVTGAYRGLGEDQPSRALDRKILSAARAAVKQRTGFSPFGSRWTAPLAAAAAVVLCIGLVLFMSQQGAGPEGPGAFVPTELSPAPAGERPPTEPSKPLPETMGAREKRATEDEMKSAYRSSPGTAAPASVQEKVAPGMVAAPAKWALAEIIAVETDGPAGAYRFNVTILSPDTGCRQYADWWEVVSEDGKLLYRRVLAHSHSDEQPFARSGGPVPILPDTVVWVRAHMNPGGYGGQAMKGSVKGGFRTENLRADYAAALAESAPRPEGCAF